MNKYAFAFLMLICSTAWGQQLANCAPGVPCTTSGPSNTETGDPPYLAFGKMNADWIAVWPTIALLTAVPANTVSGCCVLISSQAPGSVTYNTTTTYAFSQSDNGNLINQNALGTCAFTLPAIGSGITTGWQAILYNAGNNACSVTPATSTINGGTVVDVPSGGWAFIQADNATNYNALVVPAITCVATSICTFPNNIKMPNLIVNGPWTGISGQGGLGQPVTHQVCLATDTTCKWMVDANGDLNNEGGIIVDIGTGQPTPSSISNCTAFGAQTGGYRTGSVVLTTTSNACTFKLTWPVTMPTGYRCSGSDETARVQINTIAHTQTSATILTGTGTGNGDVVSFTCEGY
jgi:hypothetical protein